MEITRRGLVAGGAMAGLLVGMGLYGRGEATAAKFPYRLSDAQWRAKLGAGDAYAVLRHERTERPGSSPLLNEHRAGRFHCKGCMQAAFSSTTKFESGTGWPSFRAPLPGAVATRIDLSAGFPRTEAHCTNCGGHLGHVFDDGPKPTGKRYCMNGVALAFVPGKT